MWPRNVCEQDIDMVDLTNEALPCCLECSKLWIRSFNLDSIFAIRSSSSSKNGYFNGNTSLKTFTVTNKEEAEDWIKESFPI